MGFLNPDYSPELDKNGIVLSKRETVYVPYRYFISSLTKRLRKFNR